MFARLVGNVLENNSKRTISLKEDLEILQNYIKLERLQFQGALYCEISVDENIDEENMLIPPMIFQVLTENALKHGLEKTTGGKITIKVTRKDNYIVGIVEDNGIGREQARRTKSELRFEGRNPHGIRLVEKLIKLSSGFTRKNSLKVIDLIDENNKPLGTRVEFTISYILKK